MRHPGLIGPGGPGGMSPLGPMSAGPMDGPAEPPDEQEGGEEASPEMIKAGVACLKRMKGAKPADIVREVWAAMEEAEGPEQDEASAGPGP